MKFAFRFLVVCSMLCLLAFAIDLLLGSSNAIEFVLGRKVYWPGLRALNPWWMPPMIAGAGILLPILAAATWAMGGRDFSINVKTTNGDQISLRPRAIERVLEREIRANVVDVVDVSSEAMQGARNAAKVIIRSSISDRQSIPTVQKAVREEAIRVLNQLVGVADTSQLQVVVTDVKGAAVRPVRKGNGKPRPGGGGKPGRMNKRPKAELAFDEET